MDFQGRIAIVTGGTGALGSAVTLNLLGNGARVCPVNETGQVDVMNPRMEQYEPWKNLFQ